MSQPSCAPFATYSCIFVCKVAKSSERDRSSTTKSGHKGGNSSCSSKVNGDQRERLTQSTPGERLAPLGSVNPVDESKPKPVPSASTHCLNSPMRVKLRVPVYP